MIHLNLANLITKLKISNCFDNFLFLTKQNGIKQKKKEKILINVAVFK